MTSTATVQLLLSSACVDNLRQEWFKSEVFIENFAFFCLQNVTSFAFASFAQVFLFARGTLSLLLLPVVALSPQSLSDSSSLSQIRGALISFVLNSTKTLIQRPLAVEEIVFYVQFRHWYLIPAISTSLLQRNPVCHCACSCGISFRCGKKY